MEFAGFPDRALLFYEGLEADNSKPYWTDNKAAYDECVKGPMEALLRDLEPRFGAAKFFRPYRDVRFSNDKTPYKTHAAAAVEGPDGSGALYLQFGADGLFLAGGYYMIAKDQVDLLRAAVADDRTGPQVERVLDALRRQSFEVSGPELVRVPPAYAKDHPRAELLRHKSLTAHRHLEPGAWLHTPQCRERVIDSWQALAPLGDWLERNVGRSRG